MAYHPDLLILRYMASWEQWCSVLVKSKEAQEKVGLRGKQNEKAGEKVNRVSLW